MELSPTALVLLGLLLAAWTFVAGWLVLSAGNKTRQARAARSKARRLTRMMEDSPAVPLLVRADMKIEGPDKLAGWLGFDSLPGYLSELSGEGSADIGLSEFEIGELTEAVRRTQKTAAPFRMVVTPRGSERSLALRGQAADPIVAPPGAALVWWFDFSESQGELTRLRERAKRARDDFAALVGLIEAAPMPMWFRGPDMKLRLVNSAYVKAVGAESADAVVEKQIELIERVDGLAAAQIAAQARDCSSISSMSMA